jgi:hypothetical protein
VVSVLDLGGLSIGFALALGGAELAIRDCNRGVRLAELERLVRGRRSA